MKIAAATGFAPGDLPDLSPAARSAAQIAREERQRAAATPSWQVESVTATAHHAAPSSHPVQADRTREPDTGMAWGTLIHVLFRTPSGWDLVDYKTDQITPAIPELVAGYRSQVRTYGAHWFKPGCGPSPNRSSLRPNRRDLEGGRSLTQRLGYEPNVPEGYWRSAANSSMVSPDLRIKDRNVPGSSSS